MRKPGKAKVQQATRPKSKLHKEVSQVLGRRAVALMKEEIGHIKDGISMGSAIGEVEGLSMLHIEKTEQVMISPLATAAHLTVLAMKLDFAAGLLDPEQIEMTENVQGWTWEITEEEQTVIDIAETVVNCITERRAAVCPSWMQH